MDADVVLEGGGVKGIGLVGAISVLQERGYVFHRVAGTSAGCLETPRQSGAREGHQPGIIQQGPGSGRWPAPRASLWSRPGAVQVAGAQEDAAAWSVRVPVPASR